jgi:hypothetical protein
MAHRWDARDIEGYTRLLDPFVAGDLHAEPFSQACVTLWAADRDLKTGFAGPKRGQMSDRLLEDVNAKRLSPHEFGLAWADLWACGYERPTRHARILNLLHHWAYHYTTDAQLRAEDPRMYIDEWRLWDVMMALRAVLRCLTEENGP